MTALAIYLTLAIQVALVFCTCRDRYGELPEVNYNRRSCAMCYAYLFNTGKFWTVHRPSLEYLVPSNITAGANVGPLAPDGHNETVMNQVCNSLNPEECERWRSCCISGVKCCQRQLRMADEYTSGDCVSTWDGYSCWDATPPGQTVTTACPSFLHNSLTTRRAIKTCTTNGTWWKREFGLEWTNYTPCLDKQISLSDAPINNGDMFLVTCWLCIYVIGLLAYS